MPNERNFTLSYNRYCQNNKLIIQQPSTNFVGCFFCKKKYDSNLVTIFYLNTDAACPMCHIDSIVAWQEIPGNTEAEKFQQLKNWYNEGFSTD